MMNVTYSGLLAPKPAMPLRDAVLRLEAEILKRPQVECPVDHLFGAELGARRMLIPAGTVLTGAVHKTRHFCIVARGRILVPGDEGVREFRAGDMFISEPGVKRVGFALEDTVWITVHHTDTTDVREFVAEITDEPYENLLDVRMALEQRAPALIEEAACP